MEIITSGKQAPNKDWLSYAVSGKALTRIRSFLRNQERGEAIRLGREKVLRESRRLVKKPEELLKLEPFREWMRRHGWSNLDDTFAAVGADRVDFAAALQKLFPPPAPKGGQEGEPGRVPAQAPARRKTRRKRKSAQLVSISGLDNLMVRFAKCCAPVYGDAIKGIITRGRGISIHQPTCHNLTEQVYRERRVVEVQWVDNTGDLKPVSLAVRATTSMKDLIALVDRLEEEENAPITPGRIIAKQGVYTQHLTLMVGNSKQLDKILTRLNAIEGVSAERILESA